MSNIHHHYSVINFLLQLLIPYHALTNSSSFYCCSLLLYQLLLFLSPPVLIGAFPTPPVCWTMLKPRSLLAASVTDRLGRRLVSGRQTPSTNYNWQLVPADPTRTDRLLPPVMAAPEFEYGGQNGGKPNIEGANVNLRTRIFHDEDGHTFSAVNWCTVHCLHSVTSSANLTPLQKGGGGLSEWGRGRKLDANREETSLFEGENWESKLRISRPEKVESNICTISFLKSEIQVLPDTTHHWLPDTT